MKAQFDAMLFKQVLDGTKHAVCNDDSRPILRYIKLDIKKGSLTAYALDGYRMAKVVATDTAHSDNDEFVAYIKPFTIPKKTADMIFPVEVEKEDNVVNVSMQTDDGRTTLSFAQPDGQFVDAESILADAQEHSNSVAANARYVSDAVLAVAKATHDRNNCAIIETKENKTKAFLIKGSGDGIDVTQLILPIRMAED